MGESQLSAMAMSPMQPHKSHCVPGIFMSAVGIAPPSSPHGAALLDWWLMTIPPELDT